MTVASEPLLRRACESPTGRSPEIEPLPPAITDLLIDHGAPPRLGAHLRAVFDTAVRLTGAIADRFPAFEFDRDEVTFGAATHDIGKTLHPAELIRPGSQHEEDGEQLLLDTGVQAELARFARTHANWTDPQTGAEDLLVALADKVWKGKRVEDLEQRVVQRIQRDTGTEPWDVFLVLDDILVAIAEDADDRLNFQNEFPAA